MLLDEMYVNSKIMSEAEKSTINSFRVSDNHFVFKHKMGSIDSLSLKATKGDIGSMQILQNQATNQAELTKSECEAVRSFILSSLQ